MAELCEKLEEAMQSVVTGLALSGVASLTGSDDATKTSPNVICRANVSEPDGPAFSGNYTLSAEAEVNSQAGDDSLATHRTRVAAVFDAFQDDGLIGTLSAAVSDFTVQGIVNQGYDKGQQEDTQWSDRILLDVYCCGTDIL